MTGGLSDLKPILIFPAAVINKDRQALARRNIPRPTLPSHARQAQRLNEQFTLLTQNFSNGILDSDPSGFAPERTLVLETIGPVDNFYRIASKIEGLGFIHDLIGDEIEPDEDFYYEDENDKNLKGHVYLTMANQNALELLMRYWKNYEENRNYTYPLGLNSLKELFKHLYKIRYWDTNDRLRETKLIEDWEFRINENYQDVPVEIELWCRPNKEDGDRAENRIRRLVEQINGTVIHVCRIDEILYHTVLAVLPTTSIKEFIEHDNQDIELLRCDEVMYFRPTGQCSSPTIKVEENNEEEPVEEDVEVIEEPIIALLDGLPIANHIWLKDYITLDDPDDWSDEYNSPDRIHGTNMASLIIRGDMQSNDEVIPRKIYCRPIMKPAPSGFGDETRERIPDGILPIDIVHRAVVRLFEAEGDEEPIAPTIKILNLSVADPYRLFDGIISPWAKLIDYLSVKYNVLFVISAGNHTEPINLGITNKEFNDLTQEERESLIVNSIAELTPYRRLMSPSESINAITVGAYHSDKVEEDEFRGQINPYMNKHAPSPVNPVTWGRKRSVKPEILMPGGRATYRLKGYVDNDTAVLEVLDRKGAFPPGQKVAHPGNLGSLNSSAYTFGTSNASAMAARRLCFLYGTLNDLYSSSEYAYALTDEYETTLLKAMLCHGTSLGENGEWLKRILPNEVNVKATTAKFTGFGNVNEERIHGCMDNQATIIQCGNIKGGSKHIYKLPLPDSLNGKIVYRRLIITLAWLSPTKPNSNNAYRLAHLYFKPAVRSNSLDEDNPLEIERRETDSNMVRNGTVQHEVLLGDKACAYADGTYLNIVINCKYHQDKKTVHIPYGLIVTLDTPGVELPIYEEVKAGLQIMHQQYIETTGVNV